MAYTGSVSISDNPDGLYLGQLSLRGMMKFIYYNILQQSATGTFANNLTIMQPTNVTGFTIGKSFIFDISFTFACNDVQNNCQFSLFVDGTPMQILQFVNDQSHACHSVKFKTTSSSTSHTLSFTVQEINNNKILAINDGDYVTIQISEIN